MQASYLTQLYSYGFNIPCVNNDGTPLGDNSVTFAWGQDVAGDPASKLGLLIKTKKQACGGLSTREIKIDANIVVQRATTLVTFETEPVDAAPDVFFDASEHTFVEGSVI